MLRIRASGSPLMRSAYGRVLSSPYAAIWPLERCAGARVRRASCPSLRRNTLRSGTYAATVFRVARMAVSGAIPVAGPAAAAT